MVPKISGNGAGSGPSGEHSNRNQHIDKRNDPEGPYPYGPVMHEHSIAGSGPSGDGPSGGNIRIVAEISGNGADQ